MTASALLRTCFKNNSRSTTGMDSTPPNQPLGRQEFRIGIICALPHEASMVNMVLDKSWEKGNIRYGKASRDINAYTTGAIAGHNVVIAHCPAAGNINATQVACSMLSSFSGVEIIFVVGICGAVPFYTHLEGPEEILLGDCIISTGVVQLDLGREGLTGFKRKRGLDALGRPPAHVQGLLTKLQANRSILTQDMVTHLQVLQTKNPAQTAYPGITNDRLYSSNYSHAHRQPYGPCSQCDLQLGICNKPCEDLGCEDQYLEHRIRLESDRPGYNTLPKIHFGRIGSSNAVLKSATRRDMAAKVENIIAFEMEGAGVWDVCPTILIKAACDYADSHKNKDWQQYAAAVAAAGLKMFLYDFDLPDKINPLPAATYLDRPSIIKNNDYQSNDAQQFLGGRDAIETVIHDADTSLRKYYRTGNRLNIERISGEKLPLNRCYINLAVVDRSDQKQQADSNLSLSLRARLKLDASHIGKQVSLEDLFQSKELANGTTINPRRIFIQGRAGVGKSTLCKKIVHESLENGLANSLFDRLLWIPLRRLKSTEKEYGWLDLIQDVHPLTDPKWKRVRETYSHQFYESAFLERSLLLFDGLDEISWKQGDKMHEFLESILNESPNVIITSRPQANRLDMRSFDLELETIGFLPEQIDTYISHCVPQPNMISEIRSFMVTKPIIKDMLRIPVQLDAFCYVWVATESLDRKDTNKLSGSGKGSISTMTTLYQSIMLELCRMDIARLSLVDRPYDLVDFEINKVLETELTLVKELAFQGLLNSIAEFNAKHLDKIGASLADSGLVLPIPYRPMFERTSFLRCSNPEQKHRSYHFMHLTFQEFFAAKYFAEHWSKGTGLVCLQLAGSGAQQEIEPFDFLRQEKYNPRYNIFWRFVTGLIQIQSEEQNQHELDPHSIVAFFDLLHSEPIDLVKAGQRRLIMYCLSELKDSTEGPIQGLRHKEEDLLRGELIRQYKIRWARSTSIFAEDEFPERVVRYFLEHGHDLPLDDLASSLKLRKSFEITTLTIISKLLSINLSSATLLQLCGIIFKHCTADLQEILTPAVQVYDAMTKHSHAPVRNMAAYMLHFEAPPPEQAVNAVILLLKDEDFRVQNTARFALKCRQDLSHRNLVTLTSLLQDETSKVRELAAGIFRAIRPLPQAAVVALTALCQDKHRNIRETALYALGRRSTSPTSCTSTETISDEHEDHDPQSCTSHESTSGELAHPDTVNSLVIGLKSRETQVRWFSAQRLAQLRLSKETIVNLIAMLKDTDDHESIEHVLLRSSFTKEAVPILVSMLKDSDIESWTSARILSRWSLPEDVVTSLVEMIQIPNVAGYIPRALDGSIFPEATIVPLTCMLQENDKRVRKGATLALARQSGLPREALIGLIRTLEDGGDDIICQALQRCQFHSVVPELDDQAWQNLYTFWLRSINYSDITCYEFENSLWLWKDSIRYQLLTDPIRTKELIQLARAVESKLWSLQPEPEYDGIKDFGIG